MKKVSILGSTGSIGKATLDVINHLKPDFSVFALAAKSNYQMLTKQIIATKPKIVVTSDDTTRELLYADLKKQSKSIAKQITILTNIAGLNDIALDDNTDILVMAMSGTEGIIPLLKGIERKKQIALSTKELLVGFGKIIMAKARKYNAQILPIDSELVGLHQCLFARNPNEVKKVIITASGGPFFRRKNLSNVTISETLKHPIWKMGKKITVDSATFANKGLEVIETSRLFSIPPEKIEVVIHPQSIVHSLVEFTDNSLLAALSLPDMRVCIQYALTFPKRVKSLIKNLDLTCINSGKLEFYKPDLKQFPGLKLAYKTAQLDGTAPCIFNAANETAVNAFLNEKIDFVSITKVIEKTLKALPHLKNPDLLTLLKYEVLAKNYAERMI